ncbi:MAG: YqaE/Pmp3 family membrane protein [Planctomycetaceae bacterium]|nr:YqaE/Pmp3 family membrane protein [Planctomycetaceae bacterium]
MPTDVVPKDSTTGDVIRILLAIFLPPVGVFFEVGLGLHFWLNILLTLFGYIPGIIHAVWIIVRK